MQNIWKHVFKLERSVCYVRKIFINKKHFFSHQIKQIDAYFAPGSKFFAFSVPPIWVISLVLYFATCDKPLDIP